MSRILSFNVKQFSEVEACSTFHNDYDICPRTKEFWKVDHIQNNFDILQSLLDVLYNNQYLKIRIYSVNIHHQQSSSRLVIRCNLCIKDLSSYEPFISHHKGKVHKRVLSSTKEDLNPNIGPLEFKTSKQISDMFYEGTLEYKLDTTKDYVIGFQMLYVEIYENLKFYTCRLCSIFDIKRYKRMEFQKTFDHILSDHHKKIYLNTRFPKEEILNSQNFHEAVKYIQRKEGCLVSKICTLSNSDIKSIVKLETKFHSSNRPENTPDSIQKYMEDDVQIQTDDIEDDLNKLAEDMVSLQRSLCSEQTNHSWTQKLIEDDRTCELLCCFIVAMAQKCLRFSEVQDYNFKDSANKLLDRCQLLSFYDI